MAKRGYLDGAEMATTFNMLRANDLIWSFVINNYLLGKEPFPFDLLYWNSDSTRMPAAMHSFYLRKCYHENALVQPGASQPRRRADRPAADRPPGLLGLDPRGSHRALEEHLCRDPALSRPAQVRAGRVGPHRRGGQPAGFGQVRLLDQRRAAGGPGGLARGRHAPRGLLVDRLGRLECRPFRRQGAGPDARRRQAAGARGRAGQLREGARPEIQAALPLRLDLRRPRHRAAARPWPPPAATRS